MRDSSELLGLRSSLVHIGDDFEDKLIPTVDRSSLVDKMKAAENSSFG